MKIAILGGTFDPVHHGHLELARSVVEIFDVDEFHFVPAFVPPHKSRHGITSAFHRFAMVALATASEPRCRVSTIETDTLEARYSVDTLDLMREQFPDSPLLFITGTDMYQEIEEWRSYRRLFELASMAVVHRPGFAMREDIAPFATLEPGSRTTLTVEPAVYYMPWLRNDISSTRIRDAASRNESTETWTPPAVATYIRRHRLYR